MSINTHGIIPHRKTMLVTRRIIYLRFLFDSFGLAITPQPARPDLV
jgi:hypothetical protein